MTALLLTALLAFGQIATYPGGKPKKSPNGQFVVSCTPQKALVMKGASGQCTLVPYIERSVDILWSPTSEFIAVTDNAGSAESVTFVISTSLPSRRHEVNPPPAVQRELDRIQANHVYITGLRWLSNKQLLVGIYAFGNTPGPIIKKTFEFQVPAA